MTFIPETGEYASKRSDLIHVDPRGLEVNWEMNIARQGREPEVNESLIRLAKDIMPKKGASDGADGSTGQLHPVTARVLSDKRLQVVGGFRRTRAALWLIESGTCPDFQLMVRVVRMNDAEAAFANFSENFQRDDPQPVETAHAIRYFLEDHGMAKKDIASRLKITTQWLDQLLQIVQLPTELQEKIASKELAVSAGVEIVKSGGDDKSKIQMFKDGSADGQKPTADNIRKKRRQQQEEKAKKGEVVKDAPIRRNMKDLREFLQTKTGPADPGKNLASYLLDFMEGKKSMDQMDSYWDKQFPMLTHTKTG